MKKVVVACAALAVLVQSPTAPRAGSCGEIGQAACPNPPKCKPGATQNPAAPGACIACGGTGQVPCEPTTNSTVDWVPPQTVGGPVWGWADLHTHMFANEAYGGAVIWGKPFDPNGFNRALAPCDYTWDFVTEPSWVIDTVSAFAGPLFSLSNGSLAFDASHAYHTGGYPVHGTNWVTWHALLPTQTLFGLSVNMATGNVDHTLVDLTSPAGVYNFVTTGTGMHHTTGVPDFYRGTEASHGWPHFLDGAHQQMYYKWVERAYRAGLRLLVDMPVNNDVLCDISIQRQGYLCDDMGDMGPGDMTAVRRQIDQIHALEDFIDLENDGIANDNGWYRIARSPQEARQIIESGAMAVVIGIEVDSLFNCKPGTSHCDDDDWLADRIEELWNLDVRHIYPVHMFDNVFTGGALYGELFMFASYLSTGRQITSFECTGIEQFGPDGESILVNYTFPCNARGLKPAGEKLLNALMDRGMIIDVDHLPHLAMEGDVGGYGDVLGNPDNLSYGALDILEAHDYPPYSSHTVMQPNTAPSSEFGHTTLRVRRMLEMGGMIAMNPPRRFGDTSNIWGTSREFIDGVYSTAFTEYGYLTILDTLRQAIADNNEGLTQLDRDWLDPEFPSVGLATDMGAFVNQPGPRFNDLGYGQYEKRFADDPTGPLLYPFAGFEPSNKEYPNGTKTGVFYEQRSGNRRFDFNVDGMAHYGLWPDLLADVRQTLDQRRVTEPDTPDLEPLLHSAEAFIRMWERIPAFAGTSDADGDGVADGTDNCPWIANANQDDRDGDGIGYACDNDTNGDPCDDICDSPPCTPDPCCDVTCDAPPNTECWAPTGTCSGGDCTYTELSDGTPCDDDDPCTTDACDGTGTCVSTTAPTGTACDDGDPCTHTDTCDQGTCSGISYTCPSPVECEAEIGCDGRGGCAMLPEQEGLPCTADVIECTVDACDGDGLCDHPVNSESCYIDDTCIPANQEEPGNPCALCLPWTSQATYSPVDNGTPCATDQICGGSCISGHCGGGTARADCDDDNPCTTDTCDQTGCGHEIQVGASCDDGNPNTINDYCDSEGLCGGYPVQHDGGPAEDGGPADGGPTGGDSTSSGTGGPDGGCSCNGSGESQIALLALLGFGLLRRRR